MKNGYFIYYIEKITLLFVAFVAHRRVGFTYVLDLQFGMKETKSIGLSNNCF